MENNQHVLYEEENDLSMLEDPEILGKTNQLAEDSFVKNSFIVNSISRDKTEEIKNTKKTKIKDKLYTIKTLVDKNVGTDWYNIKASLNLIPSPERIEKQIVNVLNGCNLNTLTLRKLYGLLSICFNINLLNIDIPNIDEIIKRHLTELKNSENTSQDVKRNKRVREKKKILIKSLTDFMEGNDTASLKTCAIKIKQYCEENHLNHPSNAKLFILDSNLQDIFPGRDSISRHVSEILAVLKMSNTELENDQSTKLDSGQNNFERRNLSMETQ